MKVKYIVGVSKLLFTQWVKVVVFFHYLGRLSKREISFKHFTLLLRRLLVYIGTLKENKFCRIEKEVKLDLYVPFFQSPSFFKACDKFSVFGEKLPCTIALLSVTKSCYFRCPHCYQREDRGGDVALEHLLKATETLIEKGVVFFNIEGGDPFLAFDRLYALCELIGSRGEIFINSTGHSMTLERVEQLKKVCNLRSIMFSLHSPREEGLNRFMGRDTAWDTLQKGVSICGEAGVPVSINCCLQRDEFFDGTFEAIMSKAVELSAFLVQFIHPKAAGAWLAGGFQPFSDDDLSQIKAKVKLYNTSRIYRKYPVISAQVVEEDSSHYGCTAGGTDRLYINAKGDLQPCEFLNISFGNISERPFSEIYDEMRAQFQKPGQNWLCERCSEKIHSLHKEGSPLPLSVKRSQEVYADWDRGEPTPMYKKTEEDLS